MLAANAELQSYLLGLLSKWIIFRQLGQSLKQAQGCARQFSYTLHVMIPQEATQLHTQ